MLRPACLLALLTSVAFAQDLLQQTQVLRKEGMQSDFPAMCADGDGKPWVAYVQWDGKEDTLHVAKLADGVLKDVLTVNGPGIIHQPAMVRDGTGMLHVFWSQVNDKNIMDLKHTAIPYENTPKTIDGATIASSPNGGNVFAKAAVTIPRQCAGSSGRACMAHWATSSAVSSMRHALAVR